MYSTHVTVSFDGLAYPGYPTYASSMDFLLNGKVIKRIIPVSYSPTRYSFKVNGIYGENKFEFRGPNGGNNDIGMIFSNLKIMAGARDIAHKGKFFTRRFNYGDRYIVPQFGFWETNANQFIVYDCHKILGAICGNIVNGIKLSGG